jgi:hypothetical protein
MSIDEELWTNCLVFRDRSPTKSRWFAPEFIILFYNIAKYIFLRDRLQYYGKPLYSINKGVIDWVCT